MLLRKSCLNIFKTYTNLYRFCIMDPKEEGEDKAISKSQLKKLEKEAKRLKQKEEKAAKQSETQGNQQKEQKEKKDQKNKADQEEELDPRLYYENRSKVILELKQSQKPFPYPHKFHVEHTIADFRKTFDPKCTEKGVILEEIKTSIAGRVISMRAMGSNLMFYDLQGDGQKVQVMANSKFHNDPDYDFEHLHSIIRRGDIIGVKGSPCRTKAGELSIAPGTIQLLSPSLHMLPKAHYGFKDIEKRYRMRYLDLIMNQNVRDIFYTRANVIRKIREFLDKREFLEVETPTLNMIPGGATAKPFVTYHNDLARNLFMRVAPELYLKVLITGGLERVYEIGKNFRNESIDQTHNPEFTAIEFYQAYIDYEDLMVMTEEMLSEIVFQIKGSYKFVVHNEKNEEVELDFTRPWKRVPMLPTLEKHLGEKIPEDLESEETRKFLDQQCIKHKVDCSAPRSTARLIDKLVGHFMEVEFKNPTFLIEHPQIMSPLSKFHRKFVGLTERFELFVNYHELCNAFTELNDPFVQKELFLQQVKAKEGGDDEAMGYDDSYIKCMEHGLPPQGDVNVDQ